MQQRLLREGLREPVPPGRGALVELRGTLPHGGGLRQVRGESSAGLQVELVSAPTDERPGAAGVVGDGLGPQGDHGARIDLGLQQLSRGE